MWGCKPVLVLFVLLLYGFTDLERIMAHRSRSAQGRVHLITTYPPSKEASGLGCQSYSDTS